MNCRELCKILGGKIVNIADENRQVIDGYAGDFLSYVIGKAPTDCVWFTVMNNVNVCAVATLAEVSVVALCDGVMPDKALEDKFKQQDVNAICVPMDVFNAIKKFVENSGDVV